MSNKTHTALLFAAIMTTCVICAVMMEIIWPTDQQPQPHPILVIPHPDVEELRLGVLAVAIAYVESELDENAIGELGEIGVMQISEIMVDECNRISAMYGGPQWSMGDRFDARKSGEMFLTYTIFWNEKTGDSTFEGAARRWNGGPAGHKKESTIPYWKKVRSFLLPAGVEKPYIS